MSDTQVADTLRRLLTECAGIPGELVELDSTFEGALAMDSLSFVSFQVEIEQAFGIDCPLEDLYEVRKFGEVVEIVERKLAEAEAVR